MGWGRYIDRMRLTWTLAMLGVIFMTNVNAEMINVGAVAPSLKVTTDAGTPLDLAEVYKKGTTLVYFYPKADTPGCTVQACDLRDNTAELNNAGVQVIGVSADTVEAQAAFKKKYNLNFTLVADTQRETIKAFGVTGRSSFLVKNGKVAWVQQRATPATQAQDAIAAAKAGK